MKIKRIAHVCLKSDDLAATREFYELLGARHGFDFRRGGEVIGFYLRVSDRDFIEVFRSDAKPESVGMPPLDHVCFETVDIRGLREKLAAAGREPGAIKRGCDQSWQFWVTGPEGTRIEFHEYTDASAQFGSADVEVDW